MGNEGGKTMKILLVVGVLAIFAVVFYFLARK